MSALEELKKQNAALQGKLTEYLTRTKIKMTDTPQQV